MLPGTVSRTDKSVNESGDEKGRRWGESHLVIRSRRRSSQPLACGSQLQSFQGGGAATKAADCRFQAKLYILKPFRRTGCTGTSNAARWISLLERFRSRPEAVPQDRLYSLHKNATQIEETKMLDSSIEVSKSSQAFRFRAETAPFSAHRRSARRCGSGSRERPPRL